MRSTKTLVRLATGGLADGPLWYPMATAEIARVADAENWSVADMTAILAISSPRCTVRRNVRNTLQYLGTGRYLASTMQSIRSATRHWQATGRIRGQKTAAFAAALSGDVRAIVLDVHMARLLDVDQRSFDRIPIRQACIRRVTAVAAELQITPRECQATLWCAWKRSIGESPEPMPILQEYRNWLRHGRCFPSSGTIELKG